MTQDANPMPISAFAQNVQPSATLAAAALAKQMKAEGITVYDFSVGEPDFPTPDHICEAANEAMRSGHTHYTPAPGIAPLRQTIAKWYQQRYQIEYAPEQVIVSNGAKHSIHNALSATVGPGDEVIIPTPYWVSYSELVKMTGATPVLIPTALEQGFKLLPDQLREAMTPQSKLIMLNSPSNPTGAVYTRPELEALADVILDSSLCVLSDEIYEQLVYEGEPTCFATLRPELKERTLTISGVSKSYAMTGWRMGWTLGPAHIIKAMSGIQSQQTGNPNSVSQLATIAALVGDQSCVEKMRQEFQERRDLVLKQLSTIPGLKCFMPKGAFYVFFDVSSYLGKEVRGRQIPDSTAFCVAALEMARVNLVTGAAFGAEGFVRMSYAASRDELKAGVSELEGWLQEF